MPARGKEQAMTGPEIYAEMVKRGIRQKAIADKAQVSGQFVHQVIYRKRTSRRVQEIIAAAIGKRRDSCFPLKAA